MKKITAAAVFAFVLGGTSAFAAECAGNSFALGTARTIAISAADYDRVGTMQYKKSLPLADKEVVLTFDDGPIPPYTNRVLETLASECVKATFFLVGQQARHFPDVVRRLAREGHTIASHSQHHPVGFRDLDVTTVSQEVDQGIAAIAAILGHRKAVAPFFRIPGLSRSNVAENYLAARGLSVWSADFAADDWRHIAAQTIVERALARLERKRKGILLLHDIQPATALALPQLLQELKSRGYRIVHVVPAGPLPPARPIASDPVVAEAPSHNIWPRVLDLNPDEKTPRSAAAAPSDLSSGKSTLGLRPGIDPSVEFTHPQRQGRAGGDGKRREPSAAESAMAEPTPPPDHVRALTY